MHAKKAKKGPKKAEKRPEVARDTTEAQTPSPAETESLLDEIDEVLETNAAEFIKGYVQKGGQ